MASYPFWCDCGYKLIVEASIHNHPPEGSIVCRECGSKMFRDFSGIHVDVFQPFTDHHIGATPVHFSSRHERDLYLKSNNLTYDSTHWHRRQKYKPAIDSVTFDEVMEKLNNEGPPKEEIVQDIGEVAAETARFDDPASS